MSDTDDARKNEGRTSEGRFIAGQLPPVGVQFQPGNPGRKKGARNQLDNDFVAALLNDFREHGVKAIMDMRDKNPGEYVRAIVAVLPKEHNVRVGDLDELTDDQLVRQLAAARKELAASGIEQFARVAEKDEAQPPEGLSTLQ